MMEEGEERWDVKSWTGGWAKINAPPGESTKPFSAVLLCVGGGIFSKGGNK